MKIRIDKYGKLEIERAGQLKPQECPHAHSVDIFCGDWCPRFGEPEERHKPMMGGGIGPVEAIELSVCKRVWKCKPEDFEDQR